MQGSKLVAGAAKSASYNMILQFSLRVTTFILNAFILRYVSREMLGIVNVRLTLLYSTTLFLAKEAFDKACLSKSGKKDWQQVINLLWCTFPLALVCCSLLSLVWLYLLDSPSGPDANFYRVGVLAFAISTCIEVLAEPLFVIGQAFLFVKLKVVLLGLSQGIKCLITVFLVLWVPHWGIINFSIAQVMSSITYVTLYHLYFIFYVSTNNAKKIDGFPLKSIRDIYPKTFRKKPFVDTNLVSLTWSFFKQSFLKQILTEGEKYVMTFFDVLSFGDQGIYDVINNLGSMAARFVFQPIEENCYLLFSQLLSRGVSVRQQNQESLQLSSRVLGITLKAVILFGAIILIFGYSNSYLALHLYGGDVLTIGNGPSLLRWYCLYVLVIAVNGTTEAFVFAAMSKEDVDRYNQKMVLFSLFFLLSSWFLTTYIGSVGFIIANCINMLARILHSIYFIFKYFGETKLHPLSDIFPSLPVVFSLVASLVITAFSEAMFCHSSRFIDKLLHIGVSAVCLVFVLAAVYVTERRLLLTLKDQLNKSKGSQEKDLKKSS